MDVTVPRPEEFTARFGSEAELGRHGLEVLALDEYRAGRMSRPELRQVLGFGTRGELDGFLRGHGIIEDMMRTTFSRSWRTHAVACAARATTSARLLQPSWSDASRHAVLARSWVASVSRT